jgi:hypothetical protein
MSDVDSAETAYRVRAGAYAVIIASVAGGLALMLTGSILIAAPAAVMAVVVVYAGVLFIAERGGRVGAWLYQPSGSSTPAVREYSYADSLVARAQHQEAVAAYRQMSREHPTDPEPRIREARVLRDWLNDYEGAAAAFRQALHIRGLRAETEQAMLRELIELHIYKHKQPQRALPYLAQLADKFSGSGAAEWARAEARSIKASLQRSDE